MRKVILLLLIVIWACDEEKASKEKAPEEKVSEEKIPEEKPPYEATWMLLKEVDGSYVIYNYPSLWDEGKTKSPSIRKIHGNQLTEISPSDDVTTYTFNEVEKLDNGIYYFKVGNKYSFQWFDKDKHIAKWTNHALKSWALYIDSLHNIFPIVDYDWGDTRCFHDERCDEEDSLDDKSYESTWMKLTKVGDSYVVYNYPSWNDEKNKSPYIIKAIGNELTQVGYGYDPYINIYDVEKMDSAVFFYRKNSRSIEHFSFQWFNKEKHIARWRVYVNLNTCKNCLLNENFDLYVDSLHNTFPIVDYKWKNYEDNGGKASFSDDGEKAPYESTWMKLTKVGDSYVVYNYPNLCDDGETKSPIMIKINENQLTSVHFSSCDYTSSSFALEKGDKDFYFFMGQEINQTNFSFQWFDKEKHIAKWKVYSGYYKFNSMKNYLYIDSLHNTFPIVDYEWKDEPIAEAD